MKKVSKSKETGVIDGYCKRDTVIVTGMKVFRVIPSNFTFANIASNLSVIESSALLSELMSA